ncbi:MAG: enoyl-CoA hydratase/isomerase family protein [Pseudomonadota bacterium]
MTDIGVRFAREGGWGVITLDRPKALNSLTLDMCQAMQEQLMAWADDADVLAVLIEGAGDRAFCAGGDIRWLATTAKADPLQAASFFRTEYKLNNYIAHYPKPYIALVDGVCMGGGVGVSAMAKRRIMTKRTVWAMPECGIGLMPDVGASYILRQLPGGLGLYLALTGTRMTGEDCAAGGIATHAVDEGQLGEIRTALLGADLTGDVLAAVDRAVDPYTVTPARQYLQDKSAIDQHFSDVPSFDVLFDRLESAGDFGAKALEAILPGSPTSLALTLRLLNEAPETFSDCIVREFCVAAHLMEGPDFLEGVRAQIIDKDRSPKWSPAELSAVEPSAIDRYFVPPSDGPLALA